MKRGYNGCETRSAGRDARERSCNEFIVREIGRRNRLPHLSKYSSYTGGAGGSACDIRFFYGFRAYARRNCCNSARVSFGALSCNEWLPGKPLPLTLTPSSFQMFNTSYSLPMAPVAAHNTSSGH